MLQERHKQLRGNGAILRVTHHAVSFLSIKQTSGPIRIDFSRTGIIGNEVRIVFLPIFCREHIDASKKLRVSWFFPKQ